MNWQWILWLTLLGQPNYQEAAVPAYTLPDPLRSPAGRSVESPEDWKDWRRAEILGLFREHVYGTTPTTPVQLKVVTSSCKEVAPGLVRELVELEVRCQNRHQLWQLLIFRPPGAGPWPVFLGMNFCGNQSVYADPEIPLARGWLDNSKDLGITDHRASEASRGGRSFRWPVERIVSRGYALCTLYYGDVEPDIDDGFENGAHQLLGESQGWGSIAAWAWGLSRCADYLLEQDWVDRLAVLGHSRLGKAALWAGAQDTRFSLVISNDSGCGGAALSRRRFGETVALMNQQFPHWFCRRFRDYNEREHELPVDQHELMALVAPRALYVASAASDLWADPRGEELSLREAAPVFRLVGGETGYHCRPGTHNLTGFDWERFMDFADRCWR